MICAKVIKVLSFPKNIRKCLIGQVYIYNLNFEALNVSDEKDFLDFRYVILVS